MKIRPYIFLLSGLLAGLVMTGCGYVEQPPPETKAQLPSVGAIINRFGTPDTDDSTAYDKPRPVIPTRFLYYKREKLKFAFIPVAGLGDQPPYKEWQCVGVIDSRTKEPVTLTEAVRRLQARAKIK